MKLFRRDKRTRKRKIGDRGEALAVDYLKKNGYIIVERNWTHGRNEIDIIASKHEMLVFVEVKTTSSDAAESFKLPLEAVDRKKRINLTDCAREFLKVHKSFPEERFRFDVIEVYLNRDTPEINHVKDAFFAEKGNKNKWKT